MSTWSGASGAAIGAHHLLEAAVPSRCRSPSASGSYSLAIRPVREATCSSSTALRWSTVPTPRPITVAAWKSYKLKRRTVNTLSAETQSMPYGIGQIHWHRGLLYELFYNPLSLAGWEQEVAATPFVAITDSKSLYDTVTKCRNSSAHVDDKRTAIDLSILRRDLSVTKGQVRWVEGRNMLSDPLTKKMSSSLLRHVLQKGVWSLHEAGYRSLCDIHTLLSNKGW